MPIPSIHLELVEHERPCERGRYWGAMLAWGELVLSLYENTPVADAPARENVSECALPGCESGRGAFLPGPGGASAV